MWEHWVFLTDIRGQTNFNRFRDGILSHHLQALEAQKQEIKEMIEGMIKDLNGYDFTDFALEIKEETLRDVIKNL